MKRNLILIVLALCLALAGCAPAGGEGSEPEASPSQSQSESEGEEQAAPSPEEEFQARRMEILAEHMDIYGGLTREQMLEDYEYLWSVLRESFPFFGVMERRGIDAESVYETYRDSMETVTSDIQFINYIQAVLGELGNTAHLSAVSEASTYNYFREVYGELGQDNQRFQLLHDILSDPAAQAGYGMLEEVETQVLDLYQEIFGEQATTGLGQVAGEDGEPTGIADMRVLVDSLPDVPYVRISFFDDQSWEGDRERLGDFYRNNAAAEHLIIDLRGNSGGSDRYWQNNIVGLLAAEDLTTTQYSLFNSAAEASRAYLEASAAERGNDSLPLSQLPDLPALQREDLETLDRFYRNSMTMGPAEDSIRFQGRIWVLVDESVYSSSETFSMFCKDTGFATLVGTDTGGDGGGVDPLIVILPNSGIAVRLSIFYTLNPDGSNSEESATAPDIHSSSGDALEVCLAEIAGA